MTTSTWALVLVFSLVVATLAVAIARPDIGRIAQWANAVWIGVLLLISTEWVKYEPASGAAWLTLLVGIMGLNFGILLARRSPTKGLEGPEAQPPPLALTTPGQLAGLTAIYLVGFAVYLQVIAANFGGLSTLLSAPETIRAAKGESYLALVPLWARLALFLGPLLLVVYAWKPAVTRPLPLPVRWGGAAGMVLSQALLLQRTNLFVGILWLVAIMLCSSHRSTVAAPSPKRLIQVVAAGLVLFVAFQMLASALGKSGVATTGTGRIDPILTETGTVSPYLYATSGTAAFLLLTDSDNDDQVPPPNRSTIVVGDYNPQTWGRATGYLALKVIPAAEPHEPIAPFIDVGVLTNVYTWLEPFYRDFRILGVFVGPMAFGIIAGTLYGRRFSSARAFWLTAALLSCIFLAPFVAKFHSTLFIVGVLAVLLLTRSRRGIAANRSADLNLGSPALIAKRTTHP